MEGTMETVKVKIVQVGKSKSPERIGQVIDKWLDSETGLWVYKVRLDDGRVVVVNDAGEVKTQD